jgi:predicted kinase
VLDAGWPVIVDATFIERWQRDLMREQARARGAAFHILDFQVPVATLRARILQRAHEGRDASEAGLDVLQHQIDTAEALGADELTDRTEIQQ